MRLSSSEVFIESHRVFAVSFFQNILAEEVGCLLVEDTVFLESFEGIVVQNIGPEIAVVACSITADDVVEVCGTVAGSYFRNQPQLGGFGK